MALDLKSYFANIPPKQLTILIVVGLGAVVGLYGYLLMMPLWEEMGKHEATLQKLRSDIEQKQRIAANRP